MPSVPDRHHAFRWRSALPGVSSTGAAGGRVVRRSFECVEVVWRHPRGCRERLFAAFRTSGDLIANDLVDLVEVVPVRSWLWLAKEIEHFLDRSVLGRKLHIVRCSGLLLHAATRPDYAVGCCDANTNIDGISANDGARAACRIREVTVEVDRPEATPHQSSCAVHVTERGGSPVVHRSGVGSQVVAKRRRREVVPLARCSRWDRPWSGTTPRGCRDRTSRPSAGP